MHTIDVESVPSKARHIVIIDLGLQQKQAARQLTIYYVKSGTSSSTGAEPPILVPSNHFAREMVKSSHSRDSLVGTSSSRYSNINYSGNTQQFF